MKPEPHTVGSIVPALAKNARAGHPHRAFPALTTPGYCQVSLRDTVWRARPRARSAGIREDTRSKSLAVGGIAPTVLRGNKNLLRKPGPPGLT